MKRESPFQSGGTSHGPWCEKPRKTLRKRPPMVTTCSKHKNEPLEGQIRQGGHHNRRRMMMQGTISTIWRTNVCVSGRIYRPTSFKTIPENDSDITRTSQPALSWARCLCGTHNLMKHGLTRSMLVEVTALSAHCLPTKQNRYWSA